MKLKQTTITTLIALSALHSPLSQAASNIFPVGSNLGYGDASNKNTAFLVSANPAWVSNNLQNQNDYGVGLGLGFLVTQQGADQVINQYADNVQPKIEQLDTSNNQYQATQDLVSAINKWVLSTRDSFHTQINTQAALPLQISHNKVGGFGLELSGLSQGREKILSQDKAVALSPTLVNDIIQYKAQHGGQDPDSQYIIDNGLIIKSAFYTKTAQYAEGALTYGNQVFENDKGILSVGIRLKMMQAKLRKSVNDIGNLLKSTDSAGDKISNDISDTLSSGDFESTWGLDIGAIWQTPNWQAGVTLQNLNSPTFHYNSLGLGNDNQAYIENSYANQINLKESVELTVQARVEGAVYTKNKHWVLAGSADLNDTNDLLNNKYQWATVSASYSSNFAGEKWWYALIPDVRLGYRSNLTGENQHFFTPGFSWGPIDLDLAISSFDSLNNVSKDNIPEGLGANLSLELQF